MPWKTNPATGENTWVPDDLRSEDEIMASNNQQLNTPATRPPPTLNASDQAFADSVTAVGGGSTPEGWDMLRAKYYQDSLGPNKVYADAAKQSLANLGPRPSAAPPTPQVPVVAPSAPAAPGGSPFPDLSTYYAGVDTSGFTKPLISTPLASTRGQSAMDRLSALDPAPVRPSSPIDPRRFGLPASGVGDGNPTTGTPGGEAPDVDRTRINPLLSGIAGIQQRLLNLSESNSGTSAAEAALNKASREADIRSAIATEASQRSALGAARGARNRGDRALLERQAVGESAFIGQEAARTAELRQAEQEGNLGILRANEEDANRRFKAELLGKAADLGLNTAAFELDINNTNIASANNWINNEFEKMKADGQLDLGFASLDAEKTRDLMGFTRDMAALQFEYDKMDVTDRQETERLLMQRYGIDAGTAVALKQIKEARRLDWNSLLTTVIGGVGSGATAAIAAPAAASDERVKTNIRTMDDATDAEFEELIGSFTANAYDYKDPKKHGEGRRFGLMAQDLEKTALGRAMVKPDAEGVKTVQIAPLALATASGLALVFDKLKRLEESL